MIAVHVELDQRSLLTVGFSILGEEALAFVDIQEDQFCTCLIAQLLAHEIRDAEFGKRSVEESLEVALCAVRRYTVDEDFHDESALALAQCARFDGW